MTLGDLPPELQHSAALRSVIDAFPGDGTPGEDTDRPVFVLASGFRSGSTLLQRLIMSGDVLMWGEPYMETGWLYGLTSSLMHLPGRHHGRADVKRKMQKGPLHEQWVANLHPGVRQLRHAHRAMIRTLLADSASSMDYSRWGAKFVRLDGNFAHYLKWLFPNSQFVLTTRDPIASFLSYRRYNRGYAEADRDSGWMVMPNWRINSAERFFAMSHHLMASLTAARNENPQSMFLVRYEDLVHQESALAELSDWLGLRFDRRVLERRLGGAMPLHAPARPLTDEEQAAIERWRPKFRAFGYEAAD